MPDGATNDTPAAVVCSGKLYTVVRGMDGYSIWFGWVNLIDESFSGWTLLSGATPLAPTLTANSTTLCLVVRGETGGIYYRFYDIASKTWTDWTSLPNGATNDSIAAALIGNQLHIVVRAVNYDWIYHAYVNLTDNTFSDWTLLDGTTPLAPTLTANSTTLYLVVRGETGGTYYRFYNIASKTWSEWVELTDGATNDSIAATLVGNQLHIVVRALNYDWIYYAYVNLTDNTFSGWTLLDGATPSAPTLTN